jgi:hypothetical protein
MVNFTQDALAEPVEYIKSDALRGPEAPVRP